MRTVLRVAFAALALSAPVRAREGEVAEDPPDAGAKTAKALCLVKITDKDGLPLAPMALVAFEDGVYRLRTKDGREIELAEKAVDSVAFVPLEKPPRDKPELPREDGRRPLRDEPRAGGNRRERGPLGRDPGRGTHWRETRFAFFKLKQRGELDQEIKRLEALLRDTDSAKDAGPLIFRLAAALSVKEGALVPSADQVRRLIGIVKNQQVRESLKRDPLKSLGLPPPGHRPRGEGVDR